ncbi:hypothetical protein DD238_005112 [Peronospora effusa]|uniref:Amino acid transporter n=1 Tax=Peronospora effusa TaxID=542832 RepID=A0A3M6VIG3_9STRA|nr:hypothetical protein DD238_005112 [Peronospora effusa]
MTVSQSKCAFSRDSYAQAVRTSAFADFLSDDSDNEDEDDAHSRATSTMEQQTDDWFYADSLNSDETSRNPSSRLPLGNPKVLGDDKSSRLKSKVMKQTMGSSDVKELEQLARKNKSIGRISLTLGDGVGAKAADRGIDRHGQSSLDSLSSPPSFDPDDDSFFDEPRPSFSDEHSFIGEDSYMTIDTSFVYRPSVLDDDKVERQSKASGSSKNSFVVRPSLLDASLSPSILSISQESAADKTAAKFLAATCDVDDRIPTSANKFVGKTSGHTLKSAAIQGEAGYVNATVAAITSLSATKPVLSRQSSAASSSSSSYDVVSQRRPMTATRESWRISSVALNESKHAFDEELEPLVGSLQSPLASAVPAESEQQNYRITSAFEEHNAVASPSPSCMLFYNQPSFFVDDNQQSFPSVGSPSLGSRPSGDSFTNVAILGDDVHDRNERRSSDLIPQDVGEFPSNSVPVVYPTTCDALDHSYSNLVRPDRITTKPGDHDSSAIISVNGTSLGSSSLALSAASQISATSDELPFLSFSVAKPAIATELTKQQKRRKVMEKRSFVTALENSGRQEAGYEAGQVLYRSIALPRGSGLKTGKPSDSLSSAYSTGNSNFSSAALLAAIKMRDIHTDARSEETEASDVAIGTLPQLVPPLKVILASRSSCSSTSLANTGVESASSVLAVRTRASLASSASSADRLDFTGVYRGSINSSKSSINNGSPSRPVRPDMRSVRSQQKSLGERKDALRFECLGVKLERSRSDGRSMQREARQKVKNFFRDTYERSVLDEEEGHRVTNRRARACTSLAQYVDNVAEGPQSFASHNTTVAKVVDLKNLRNGGKRLGWHLQYDTVPLTLQQEESTKRRAMNVTIETTSSGTGTTATRSMPSDHIPVPRNYVVSPQATGALEPKMYAKEKAHASQSKTAANVSEDEGSGFFSVPSGPEGNDDCRSGAMPRRRADNRVPQRLAPPRFSVCESPSLSSSPFATSFATSHGLGESGGAGSGRSPGNSPVVFVATSRGFLWKPTSSFHNLNAASSDSLLDGSPVISQRSKLVDRVQNLSASVASSLRRFLYSKEFCRQNGNVNVTSPRSRATDPAALPRAYNHNNFYEIPFKVPDLNKPLLQQEKQQLVESDRNWIRQWLILAMCAVFGLCAGAILVYVGARDASIFNLSAPEVHDRQETNGELVFAAGVRWFLLPGHLFERVWGAVATPLLVCYVVNAISDLVGCADKDKLVLSFRSIGYAMMLAMLATVEGVLAMWMTHKFGWFRKSSSTARSEASILSDAIGVTPLPQGAMGLVCSGDDEYLRRLDHDVFACSNASLLLPLYKAVSTNSTDISGSGPGVFALQEVTRVFATPKSTKAYYPLSLGTEGNAAASLLLSLSPDNLAARYREVASDGIVLLGGLVVFALFLGSVCGKRILRLRGDAQAAMFESMERNDTSTENPHKAHHYLVSLLVELQLALEWMVRPMERYLAPVGFFSLMLGHVVAHHREWYSFTSPMSSLIAGVIIIFILHVMLVLPMVLKQFSSSDHRLPLMTKTKSFVPAILFAFTTDNVVLSAPVTMQCYARALTVTRSAAQVATAVTAAFTRNARGLYLPLMLLWLLETSSSEKLELSVSDYFSIGFLSMLSCFCGGSSRLTLTMARTLWSIRSSNPASALPITISLLVVCDVVLSRFATMVTLMDHSVLTHLAAQHWGETVVHGPTQINRPNNSSNSSASPLHDSQCPRRLSSAMLSSVSL